MNNQEEKILTNYQLLAITLYIISLCISFFITYNGKCNYKFISKNSNEKLSIFNRLFIVGLTILFFYINYRNKVLAKEKKKDLKPFNLQLMASELSIISSLIVLYVVLTSSQYNIVAGLENPNL